jgi:hypothetical protein
MENGTFDALTRRASLVTLGAVGLTALASSTAADARSTTKKKAKKKCQQQVGQCTTYITGVCANQECPPGLTACCDPLGVCDFTGYVDCLRQALGLEEGP